MSSGSTKVTIKASGNVGIGITTPYTKLVVGSRGTAAATSILAYDGIAFDFYNDGPPYKRHGVIISQAGDASESVLDFNTKAASGTNSTKMTILGNGNVGIGTASPQKNLHIEAAGTADSIIRLSAIGNSAYYSEIINSVSAARGFAIQTQGTDAIAIAGPGGYSGITIGNVNLNLVIKPVSDTFVFSGGDVGIGTTTPSSKLQVAGGIQMADDTDTASAAKVGTMRYRTAANEPVPVTGIDFITNGDFATDSDWTKSTNATISGGQVTLTANGAAQYIIQGSLWPANTLSGQKVQLTYTIVSNSLNAGDFRIGGYTGASAFTLTGLPTTVGTHSVTLDVRTSAGDDNAIDLYVTSAATSGALVIDNVSVIEVTEEDASYADMCMQTGASTYEWVNIVRNTY
jgi:hypothetical protein